MSDTELGERLAAYPTQVGEVALHDGGFAFTMKGQTRKHAWNEVLATSVEPGGGGVKFSCMVHAGRAAYVFDEGIQGVAELVELMHAAIAPQVWAMMRAAVDGGSQARLGKATVIAEGIELDGQTFAWSDVKSVSQVGRNFRLVAADGTQVETLWYAIPNAWAVLAIGEHYVKHGGTPLPEEPPAPLVPVG